MENENKDPIRVSVIVPVYNAESYLRICLDSILQQSLEEIEILAVDDGSKDQSAKILREYEKKYPDKIHVIYQENQGQSGDGIRRVRGICGQRRLHRKGFSEENV